MNKKTQLWFDEAQDLPKEHIPAIAKLMLSYKVDIGVVGDKLQSLCHEENVFTNLSTIAKYIKNVHPYIPKPTNKNRRINVKGLAEEIIWASETNGESFAIRKKNESEKQADSAR